MNGDKKMNTKEYITVKEMPNKFPFIKIGGLRAWIFEDKNNINECIIRVGKKILFDVQKFQEWIEKQKTVKE
jgi:hypothetical protein